MTRDLTKFRVIEGEGRGWTLDPVQPRWRGNLLAVDQTLNSSGWVILRSSADGVRIGAGGTLRAWTEKTGHEGTLQQGEILFDLFCDTIAAYEPNFIVHEFPPISRPGLKMSRPESSLVAADSLRCAARAKGVPALPMVGAQQAKLRFTGKPNAEKSEVKAALETLYPELTERSPMNEHIRDAIALGLVALEREG